MITLAVNKELFPSTEMSEADVHIITSGHLRIPAHSTILAKSSAVLESMMDRKSKQQCWDKTIAILGVPCAAVGVFIQFLYYARCDEEQMDKYGIHLLALSHAYSVTQLKQRCTKGLAKLLTVENVVDVLQLATLFNAPDLNIKCMKMLSKNFKAVEGTEGWKFMQDNDPWVELEILQFIDEAASRKKRVRRHMREQHIYLQLSEAMECLEHICTEGCTSVGPCDMEPGAKKGPCNKFSTCQGLQLSIKHFATCKSRRANGGCSRCKRMWQLLRLHASICEHQTDNDTCKVPLCRQFRLKMQQEQLGEEETRWKLLVRKVISAKAISSLSLPMRKREEKPRIVMNQNELTGLRLNRSIKD